MDKAIKVDGYYCWVIHFIFEQIHPVNQEAIINVPTCTLIASCIFHSGIRNTKWETNTGSGSISNNNSYRCDMNPFSCIT